MHKIIALIMLFVSFSIYSASRNEVDRFTLLHDRITIDRELRKNKYLSFLDVDLVLSSGLKKVINDVDNTSKETNTTTRNLNMNLLLVENANTEKYVDLDVTVGTPLPTLKIKGFHLLPSFFYNLNMGVSISIVNQNSTAVAQTYLRQDKKMGLYNIIPRKSKNDVFYIGLYQLERSDLYSSVNAATLATSGELFEFDDLNQTQKSINTDITYKKIKSDYEYLFSIEELQLHKLSSERSPLYGTRFMMHAQYKWKNSATRFKWNPIVGMHFRKRYSLHEGIYAGVNLLFDQRIPIEFTGKVSDKFITFMPMFNTKYFRFSYSYKNPFRNPQDDLWVSAMHMISINAPFP